MRMQLAVVVALGLVAVGCGDDGEDAEEPPSTAEAADYDAVFEDVSCDGEMFASPRLPSDVGEVTCGTLTVPEDRADPEGRSVVLPVAVVAGTDPAAEPLVFLQGGPDVTAFGEERIRSLVEVAGGGDVVVFDQRGAGLPEPSLDCPEVDEALFVTQLAAGDPSPVDVFLAQGLPVLIDTADGARAVVTCADRAASTAPVDLAQVRSEEPVDSAVLLDLVPPDGYSLTISRPTAPTPTTRARHRSASTSAGSAPEQAPLRFADMTTHYVALLRGINVGGKNIVPMADLRTALGNAGYEAVQTYIQSGNVLFESGAPRAGLEESIGAVLAGELGCNVPVVVRSHRQLRSIVRSAPDGFGADPQVQLSDVVFLKAPLTSAQAMRAVSLREGVDRAWPGRGVLYFERRAERKSQSRFSRLVDTPEYRSMTIRNWSTTTKLLALLDARRG